jgi:hypothetical protein
LIFFYKESKLIKRQEKNAGNDRNKPAMRLKREAEFGILRAAGLDVKLVHVISIKGDSVNITKILLEGT